MCDPGLTMVVLVVFFFFLIAGIAPRDSYDGTVCRTTVLVDSVSTETQLSVVGHVDSSFVKKL